MIRILWTLPLLACAPMQLYEGDRSALNRMLDVMEPMEITTEDRHLPRPAPLLSSPRAPAAAVPTARPPAAPPAPGRGIGAPKPPPSPRGTPATAPGAGPSLDLEAPSSPPKPSALKIPAPVTPPKPPVAEKSVQSSKPSPTKRPEAPAPAKAEAPKASVVAPPPAPAPTPPPPPSPPVAPVPKAPVKETSQSRLPAVDAPKRENPKRQLINRSASNPSTATTEASAWASADGLTSGTGESDDDGDVGLDDLFPPAPRPKGPRDPDGNRALIGKRKGPLSDCYVNERLRDENASGTIKLLIEVPDTLPNKVSVMRSEFSKAMGNCVRRALSDVPFPGDPSGKAYRFAIPFTFRR